MQKPALLERPEPTSIRPISLIAVVPSGLQVAMVSHDPLFSAGQSYARDPDCFLPKWHITGFIRSILAGFICAVFGFLWTAIYALMEPLLGLGQFGRISCGSSLVRAAISEVEAQTRHPGGNTCG